MHECFVCKRIIFVAYQIKHHYNLYIKGQNIYDYKDKDICFNCIGHA
jgi:hypothetical protein